MDALEQSAALIRRGAELRDQSMRLCAAAAQKVEDCRQLIAAAAAARRRETNGGRAPLKLVPATSNPAILCR